MTWLSLFARIPSRTLLSAFAQLDKVLEIMYGACVAVRNHAVAGAGWQQQQHTEDATPADAGAAMFDFEQTRSKDGKLSAQEFVEATTNFPQVGNFILKILMIASEKR
jgi:hypothetical protein